MYEHEDSDEEARDYDNDDHDNFEHGDDEDVYLEDVVNQAGAKGAPDQDLQLQQQAQVQRSAAGSADSAPAEQPNAHGRGDDPLVYTAVIGPGEKVSPSPGGRGDPHHVRVVPPVPIDDSQLRPQRDEAVGEAIPGAESKAGNRRPGRRPRERFPRSSAQEAPRPVGQERDSDQRRLRPRDGLAKPDRFRLD